MEKQKSQQMNINCIMHDVLRDLWVAIAIGISVAFLAYIGAKINYKPSYTSRSTFVVSAKGTSKGVYTDMTKAQKITEGFRSVMGSQILKKKVSEELGTPAFPGVIETTVVPETNLLTLSVTSSSPEMAFRALKTILQCYQEVGGEVFGEVVLEVFEKPTYPSAPDKLFQGKLIMKKGFLIGFALMLGILIFLSWLKDTVKNEEDIKEKLDTTIFGRLYHERKYKNFKDTFARREKKLLITEPYVSFDYVESMKKIRTKLLYKLEKENAKIILVTSAFKGEGKSTFAMNLAEVLTQRSKKVLLIDGNFRDSNLAERMRLSKESIKSWGQYLAENKKIREAIIKTEEYNYELLVNTTRIPRATEVLSSSKMRMFLDEMCREKDIIIIDAPHAKKRADTEILAKLSDVSLLVIKQNLVSVKYINDTIDMLNSYGKGLLGCIFNDVRGDDGRISSYYSYGEYGRYGRYYNTYRNRVKKEPSNE